MLLPPYCLTIPCRYLRALDGRTIQVRVGPRGVVMTVDVADCQCPDMSEPAGAQAQAAADAILAEAQYISLSCPLPKDDAVLLEAMAIDNHVSGHIFVRSDLTLTQYLVRRGLAVQTPPTR